LPGGRKRERRIDVAEYRGIYATQIGVVKIILIGKRNGDEIFKLWERLRK